MSDYTEDTVVQQTTAEYKAHELGEDWERIQKTWLHTLGNLTLTGYNSEYSDRPFIEKRDMKGGFKESPLRLNQELAKFDSWNEDTIQERAASLAEKATKVWPAPHLPPEVLETYKLKAPVAGYAIEDHPYLVSGAMSEVYKVFRKEVMALDPVVTEEFLKLYVAYKAETNFVDVIPQAKRLLLSLNIKIEEINDPRGICRDVSAISRWGNGYIEAPLATSEELPYVIGLVRQSLEKQLGNGGNGA